MSARCADGSLRCLETERSSAPPHLMVRALTLTKGAEEQGCDTIYLLLGPQTQQNTHGSTTPLHPHLSVLCGADLPLSAGAGLPFSVMLSDETPNASPPLARGLLSDRTRCAVRPGEPSSSLLPPHPPPQTQQNSHGSTPLLQPHPSVRRLTAQTRVTYSRDPRSTGVQTRPCLSPLAHRSR